MLFRKAERIHGYLLPAPRFTRRALHRFLLWLLLPFLGLCLAADIGLYFLFRNFFGWCYGVMCLFE